MTTNGWLDETGFVTPGGTHLVMQHANDGWRTYPPGGGAGPWCPTRESAEAEAISCYDWPEADMDAAYPEYAFIPR